MPDKCRLAFVSNSGAIANVVRNYAARHDMEMAVHLATMEDAVGIAERLMDSGIEVIIGGGATGTLLRHTLKRPVVTISRTNPDLLRACVKARSIGNTIGVTGYKNPPDGLALYAELLGVTIVPIVFSSTAELVEGIGIAVAKGVTCVVGGGICQEIAHTYGIEGIVIIPGSEAITQALDEARALVYAQRQEREKAARLRCIIDSIHEGVVSVNVDGTIDVINKVAAERLGLDPAQAVGSHLPDDFADLGIAKVLTTGCEETDQIRRLAGSDMVVNTRPVQVNDTVRGAVINFGLVSRIHTLDRKIKEHSSTRGFHVRYGMSDIHGDGPRMSCLKQRARRFARTDAALLIRGETGTGKEVLAQSIHSLSDRSNQPFVAINCAALPDSLLESELFGYEEGAFTGAKRGGKDGLFVLAHGGSIFLDEIADISPSLQVRLLRVLEEKAVMRVGGNRLIPVDVRVISSSYKDLSREIRHGTFRSDLYFRLAVLTLSLPPLRDRAEDIPDITRALLQRSGLRENAISGRGIRRLQRYAWPGNIRELDTLVRRYSLLRSSDAPDDVLLEELLMELSGNDATPMQSALVPHSAHEEYAPLNVPYTEFRTSLKTEVDAFEVSIIMQTLRNVQYNRRAAARILGISVNTLWRKLKELGDDELASRSRQSSRG